MVGAIWTGPKNKHFRDSKIEFIITYKFCYRCRGRHYVGKILRLHQKCHTHVFFVFHGLPTSHKKILHQKATGFWLDWFPYMSSVFTCLYINICVFMCYIYTCVCLCFYVNTGCWIWFFVDFCCLRPNLSATC